MSEKHWPTCYSTDKEGGHEFEQAPGDSEGQGGLACCSPWGRKELGTTEPVNDSMSRVHPYGIIHNSSTALKVTDTPTPPAAQLPAPSNLHWSYNFTFS